MSENLVLILFNAGILALLVLDLGIVQKRAHFPSMKEAILWTVAWCLIAVAFSGFIAHQYGPE